VSNIETKVIAAGGGAGLGAAVSTFLVWLLGVLVFGGSASADQVTKTAGAVPEPAGALLAILVTIGSGILAGWAAPHTDRPDLAAALTPLAGTFTQPAPVVEPAPALVLTTPADPAPLAAIVASMSAPPLAVTVTPPVEAPPAAAVDTPPVPPPAG
jgi:hypothetical protein